jgi:hypothetical protein
MVSGAARVTAPCVHVLLRPLQPPNDIYGMEDCILGPMSYRVNARMPEATVTVAFCPADSPVLAYPALQYATGAAEQPCRFEVPYPGSFKETKKPPSAILGHAHKMIHM